VVENHTERLAALDVDDAPCEGGKAMMQAGGGVAVRAALAALAP